MVEATKPLSTQPSRETRYLVTDPYLGFWLSFLGPRTADIEPGRGDLVLRRVESSWTSWRGRAIEPVVRESLRRSRTDLVSPDTSAIGAYWTRTNDPEIDLVGADREAVAQRVTLVGSIEWHDSRPFDTHDLARLAMHRRLLPGADDGTPLLIVSRSGSGVPGVPALGPDDLLDAWR